MAEEIHYRAPDGLDLFAWRYGPADAPLTALCMHGLTRNHKDFEPLIAKLDARFAFVAVDVRGRGRSARDPDPAHYTPATYAGDMVALIDHLGLSRVALIGTSMGGLMAMVMMRKRAGRIAGVVLNDVGPVLERAGLQRIAGYVTAVEPLADWDAAAEAVARVQADIFPDFRPDDWMAFARRTFRELPTGEVILDYDPAITRTVGDVKPGIALRFAMWRLFKAMRRAPLLVIRGETSDILSGKTAARMLRRHPDAALVTVPRVGHAPILDEPEAVTAIEAFLERLAGRS